MNLDTAYAKCAEITRREARNFSYGIRLLPAVKRNAMFAVYAMARRLDDIGDGDLPAAEKTRQLAETRQALHALPEPGDDPVLVALESASRLLPIPIAAFDDLIDGCQADVDGRQYDTFDDVVWYCRCVAGSVGRLSVGIYHPSDPGRAAVIADRLGVALQLTNILRDLREDRVVGRVYLPREDLDRFGCTLELDEHRRLADAPERFAALVRFEAERAEAWYDEGLRLLPMLDHRSAACTAAMAGIYRRLLHRIAADPEPVRHLRLSVPTREKLAIAARAITRARV